MSFLRLIICFEGIRKLLFTHENDFLVPIQLSEVNKTSIDIGNEENVELLDSKRISKRGSVLKVRAVATLTDSND